MLSSKFLTLTSWKTRKFIHWYDSNLRQNEEGWMIFNLCHENNDDKSIVQNSWGNIIEKLGGSICQSLSIAINIISTQAKLKAETRKFKIESWWKYDFKMSIINLWILFMFIEIINVTIKQEEIFDIIKNFIFNFLKMNLWMRMSLWCWCLRDFCRRKLIFMTFRGEKEMTRMKTILFHLFKFFLFKLLLWN